MPYSTEITKQEEGTSVILKAADGGMQPARYAMRTADLRGLEMMKTPISLFNYV
jgi:hypothetical protein